DMTLLERIGARYEISGIFHLAAMLSTRGEFVPEIAHDINVQGTLNLLKLATGEAANQGCNVRFVFPSSIAVYGLPDVATKASAGRVSEDRYLMPSTMYGVNKLACEHLGRYYTHHYRQLAADSDRYHVDFRSIRFPGLISAETAPTGGTSDYAPEMLHAAARGESYSCFARPDTRIPFMAMPDAIDALMLLFGAKQEALTLTAYNIGAFSPSADEIRELTLRSFPGADIAWQTDEKRQRILDSWPADVDDERARADWGWSPSYDADRAFQEYLIPNIARRYETVR
ncbi:MAG: NAD-dependent epimerase/dehydratase family protein, partial [bacterium]|nr:NAD-dependent epimerase/dehydratase family protein [Candidatus Kapabacteria bacterium]